MSVEHILIVIICILSFNFVMDRVLVWLNLRAMRTEVPAKLEEIYDADKYRESQQYQREKTRFGNLNATISFVLTIVILASGFLGVLDGLLRDYIADPIFLALAFMGVLFIAGDVLSTPFRWYYTFVIEERYGFNKMIPLTFLTDKLKGYLLTVILGGGLLYLFLYLVNLLQEGFWLWFWMALSVFMLLLNFLYGTVIVPLFNKLRPLEEGELSQAIRAYCKKVEFPLKNIFIMDASKRSTKANAYFSGLGKTKQIVLYDTLVEKYEVSELVAIFAHEVGHYKKRHIVFSFIMGILQTGLMLFLLSLMIFSPKLSIALGAETPGIHLNLLAAAILYSPLSQILSLFGNYLSRKFEYQADRFARETYDGTQLGAALKKMHRHHLSNLTPHPVYVAVNHSHPSLLQRLEALESTAQPS